MRGRYLEDFTVGETITAEPVVLDSEEIISFGRRYDPQYFHTDMEAAAEGPYGGLIASGLQTIALGFAQFVRTGVLDGSSLGGPGLDEVRWTAPVRPGDTLHTEVEATYPLARVKEALDHALAGGRSGKILLLPAVAEPR